MSPERPTRAPDPPVPAAPVRPPIFDRRRLKLLPRRREGRGLLAGMRIRKKLVFLHTVFTLLLAAALLVVVRPAVIEVVQRAELDKSVTLLDLVITAEGAGAAGARGATLPPTFPPTLPATLTDAAALRAGAAAELGLDPRAVAMLNASPGRSQIVNSSVFGPCAAAFIPARGPAAPGDEQYRVLQARIAEARDAVGRLYLLVVLAVVAVYFLVAAALEVFVLPQNLYAPIRRLLEADEASRDGRRADELVAGHAIPDDELGEIMRSRNSTIQKLRSQESQLAEALATIESAANDLKRKNHLLETARRNLADADRLVSLGMMSAGIAHELNTPLAVLKGLVEKLNADPRAGMDPAQAALMRRVVGRIERLGEGLLDFARVRPPHSAPANVHDLAREAIDLVRLDRDASGIELVNASPRGLVVECDADRIVQVLVNLARNAVDSIATGARQDGRGGGDGASDDPRGTPSRPRVVIDARGAPLDGVGQVVVTVTDDGPGIDPAVLPRLFEPFVSTRLDSRGTGLGLAVSEGIIREHGGVLLARNRTERGERGAVFEIMLPARAGASQPASAEPAAAGDHR